VPLPPNQYPSELVTPDENSCDVWLRLRLPALGGLFRQRSIEKSFPYLRADRRLAENRRLIDVQYRTHNDSFSIDPTIDII